MTKFQYGSWHAYTWLGWKAGFASEHDAWCYAVDDAERAAELSVMAMGELTDERKR